MKNLFMKLLSWTSEITFIYSMYILSKSVIVTTLSFLAICIIFGELILHIEKENIDLLDSLEKNTEKLSKIADKYMIFKVDLFFSLSLIIYFINHF